jgi:mono/diheme cytochrome c family protein
MRDRTRSLKVCASAAAAVIAALVVSACGGSSESSAPRTGQEIYVASCQTCHGRNGEGFVGPSLIDTAARFPDVTAEIAVVTNGEGEMPAWGGRLTTKEIATVVDYTRGKFTTMPSTTSTTVPFVGPTQ